MESSQLSQNASASQLYKDLVDQKLYGADVQYSHDQNYQRIRSGVIAYYGKGDYKHAWLELANYLGTKNSGLNEQLNLVDKAIIGILAERENPIITKGELMDIISNKKY